MRPGIAVVLLACLSGIVHSQGFELRGSLNSNLLSFRGDGAVASSTIITYDELNDTYTENPYGTHYGSGFGFSGNVRWMPVGYLILGGDLGYESQRSRVEINQISEISWLSSSNEDATGETSMNFHFVNVYGFLGYRIPGKLHIDIIGGLEVGQVLSAEERGHATSIYGGWLSTLRNRKTIDQDIRPRIQLEMLFKKMGVYLGYSRGMVNYRDDTFHAPPPCYSQVIRFGASYRIK